MAEIAAIPRGHWCATTRAHAAYGLRLEPERLLAADFDPMAESCRCAATQAVRMADAKPAPGDPPRVWWRLWTLGHWYCGLSVHRQTRHRRPVTVNELLDGHVALDSRSAPRSPGFTEYFTAC